MTYQETSRRKNVVRPAGTYNRTNTKSANHSSISPSRGRQTAARIAPSEPRRTSADRRAAERAYYERLAREERRRAAEAEHERARLEYVKAFERRLKAEKKAVRKEQRAEARAKAIAADRAASRREIKVERARISLPFIAILLVSTLLVMAVIFSYAQLSSSSRQLSDAKETLSALETERKDLAFQLEQKNDIRLVEKIATEKIGMVKEGAVTKRFVSMSTGDTIELEATGTGEGSGGGTLGSLLSVFTGLFDNIRDYVG
ncbi:MAG: hypothetical protein IKN50_06650 [Clostridia bacterium]|nr:hypothetical protein [Clostridia bacterium]